VTADQLAQWRIGQQRTAAEGQDGQAAPVVFPVVDDGAQACKQGEGSQDLCMQLGRWSICIRQVEG
jgi:hypothetical protein